MNCTGRRRLNADEKRALKVAIVRRFVALYGRKAQKGVEPNDRKYSRNFEKSIKRMSPEALDSLLRGEEE
jgi:hypothetical protein